MKTNIRGALFSLNIFVLEIYILITLNICLYYELLNIVNNTNEKVKQEY